MAYKLPDDLILGTITGKKGGGYGLPGDITSVAGGGGGHADYLGPPDALTRGRQGPVAPANAANTLQKIFAPEAAAAPVAPIAAPAPEGAQLGPFGPSAQEGGGGGGGGGGNINNWIKQLMDRFLNDGGMGDELRMDLRNQATQTGKVRERDRILRRADDFAARGLFGSGLSNRAVQGIEAEESVALQGSLNEIEFQNAQMEAQSLRDAIGALNAQIQWKLGKGMLNVQREQMALAKLQHAEQMALAWARFNLDKLNAIAPDPGPDGGPDGDAGGGFNPSDIPSWWIDQFMGGRGGPRGDDIRF